MLEVQKWLKDNNFSYKKLKSEFGISAKFNDYDDRVILNYSQIDSPRQHPIAKECRGLVLNKVTGELIARSFPRFFNLGEYADFDKEFNFEDCLVCTKEDGSLILVYYYDNKWQVNTKGSFADGEIQETGKVWKDLVFDNLPTDFTEKANKSYTYVFELCSMYNQVVRMYKKPQLYNLTTFDGYDELSFENYVDESIRMNLETPTVYTVDTDSQEDVQYLLDIVSKGDPTFEGFVLRDPDNKRIKVKTLAYLSLHRTINNHKLSTKNLIQHYFSGEYTEIIAYFPYLEEKFESIDKNFKSILLELEKLYSKTEKIKSQKDFAFAIQDNKYKCVLFSCRKNGTCVKDEIKNHPKIFYDI